MKREILKKTLLYRTIAISLGLLLPFLITGQFVLSIIVGIVTESTSLITYYIYEYCWRMYMKKKKLRQGMKMFVANDKHGWYNVLEVQDDNKILIEVV